MAPVADPSLEKLEAIIKETLASTSDPKLKEKLTRAQELVNTASIRSKGVLNKFALDGQVAVVTGGGQGIGRSIAHALGEAGAKVAIADLDLSRAETVAAELESKGISSLAIKVDVSKKQECEEMVQTILSKFGDLHIGVNNAGIVMNSDSEDTSEREWTTTMAVNLNGAFYCCQAEAKHMLKKGYGRIINTASMSAIVVNHPQKQVAYNASKAAVVHMTKTLGTEWCDRGVTVNSISPGYTDTELTRAEKLVTLRNMWSNDTPMKRLADVEDLVGGVLYFTSQLANFTTGFNLVMDGGFTCW
ncbi:unnamed protein product [Orchesella dallaii]|uniref:Uncharacterized protein n=1 Tax=Orchesella dallaii TaxID=48710 RepID=A0ABP1RK44_9HEXA